MKTLDENGQTLDAEFDLESHQAGAFILFHARYGTRGSGREVNIDNLRALEVVLGRLRILNARITTIEVDSRVARGLPSEQRRLPLSYPIHLTGAMDVGRLRRDITEAERKVARESSAKPAGGNNHKRIRMAVKFPEGTNLDRVANTLGGGGAQPNQQLVGLDAGQRAVPHSFGPYREAVPNPSVSPAAVFTVDRESQERALAGHARIQNSLADFIRSYGLAPVSPRRGGPDFDIGSEGVGFTVAEIKSLNGANVGRQLRIGLGQVLQYRTMLTATNIAAGAVLAVEHPVDDLWVEVCSSVGVVLTWPPDWPRLGRVLGNSAHD